MSSPTPPTQTVEPDPYRYGWRYVRRTRDDGIAEMEMVPLTLEDVLHPQEGDVIPENTRHERLRRHFHNVFESRLARQPTLMTLSDCLIDWDREDLRGHSPDLIVLERDQPWPWGSWGTLHVQGEGARPLLVVELVSPGTRANDVVAKVEHYHRAGVPVYVIVDEEVEEGPLRLVHYRWGWAGISSCRPTAAGAWCWSGSGCRWRWWQTAWRSSTRRRDRNLAITRRSPRRWKRRCGRARRRSARPQRRRKPAKPRNVEPPRKRRHAKRLSVRRAKWRRRK
jgi:Uma2 family endonuclease